MGDRADSHGRSEKKAEGVPRATYRGFSEKGRKDKSGVFGIQKKTRRTSQTYRHAATSEQLPVRF